ncbi:SRPBCC family protein [Chryseobacterium sp. PTM-20240506]|uniref:SRPBCC family protein n=1 Tax=unclassified Chryseobacterium TaxID=2593645 RepID=UPI001554EAB4|nr:MULTISPECIES: SRPBCC domain-containing protein [unclassified Chryseobacterium]MDC8106246.1 SRPBCC domain-containing protein [Chryseobacterium sp. B21-037]MDQ1804750.1 SRPBCC domain-containing protein [Chryseobacterium sp. CKR4-1]
MESNIIFNKDFDANSIYVMIIYKADVSKVWDYFTKSELLDQWWAPKPWKCETVKMDFKENGIWHYAMIGPEGEKMYGQLKYGEIMEHRSFDGIDAFCDENGNINNDFPQAQWLIGFTGIEEGTKVTINIHFESQEALKKHLEMGFEEGFKMGLSQLHEVLAVH